jgi:Tol biopolymer transport system component
VTRRTAAGAIGVAAAIVLLLVAIRLLFPPTSTGSLAVSTDGTLQTGLVYLSGSGFAGGEPVDIYLDGAPAKTIDAEADGSFEGELAVGTQRTGTVSAVGRDSHNRVNTDFRVEVAGGSGSPPASDGATPGASGSADSSTEPVSPGILFYSDVDQATGKTVGKQIYLLDPVTGIVDRLTNNVFDDTFPTWSPNYTQIAFARGDVGKRDIYIRDLHGAEGSERPLVTGATDDWFPAWSKDGLVAFARAGPGAVAATATLWVIKSDGTERAAREVIAGVPGRAPAWSKDGTTLAFMSNRPLSKLDVAVVRPGATVPDYLTGGPGDERNPTWSPNGQQILFVSDEDRDQEIYLLDVATKRVLSQLTRNDVLDGNPVWSPDGKEIAFYRATSGSGYHLWKINVETGQEDDLMPDAVGQNMDPNWR